MRCNDVIRELAAPSVDCDASALAEHLAVCPACTAWANRGAALDRLWDATRPLDPPAHAWEAVWANIVDSLDSPASTHAPQRVAAGAARNGASSRVALKSPAVERVPSPGPRSWSVKATAWLFLAQAAAVLLGVGLAWHSFHPTRSVQSAEIEEGYVVRISLTQDGASGTLPSVEIEEGHVVLIQAEDPKPEALVISSEPALWGVDDWYIMFNAVESMANPVLAMKE
jgi:hypothetical protein